MKTYKITKSKTVRLAGVLRRNLWLPALCLAAGSATAATEQWLGVPGTSATTNWTDGANWTPSVQQTYYNQVQFTGTGASANTDFSINNVLDAATGDAQMPIWRLDIFPLNGNYTTLINPGVTLNLGAGYGDLIVGADAQNTSSPALANAFETITFTGAGGALSMGGSLTVGQGSTMPGDTHNVILDLSGLDKFTMDSSSGGSRGLYLAGNGFQRGNGSIYLAKTNSIVLSDVFQISNQNMSNSLPCVVELGIANDIAINGNNLVVGGGGAAAGAVMKFNPAFVGGATVPSAYLHGSTSGRISTVYIGNGNGGAQVNSTGVCDFSGGNVYLLVDSMQLGQAGFGNATGTLTFDNNYVDANNIILGNQTASSGGAGVGIVNLNTNATLGTSSTLQVRQTLTLAAATGTLTPGTAGTININGGTLLANSIVNGAGNGTINANGGKLTIGGTAGTAAAPVSNLNVTNSTLSVAIASGTTNLFVSNLKTGGTTNVINISAAPPYASYPTQVVLIKYTSLGGAGYNFGLGTVPSLYAGHLVNNTANGSIDVLFTSGSGTLTWSGNVNGNWDTTTANWLAGSPTTYADGQTVQFLDGASSSTINLTAIFYPSGLTVSNNALNYTFNGSGALAGSTGIIKSGSGTLTIDNSGDNSIGSGGVTINGGTVQIGNNDANGNLPFGNVVNNGTLKFARSDSPTAGNIISGSGSVVQTGGGTLLLSGANTYTGNTLITNNSALQVGSGTALGGGSGSTIVANGSTLDIHGNYESKPIIVSGTGVNGNGAIINSGGDVYGFASQITLAGDTTFNYAGRSDLVNATISTGGNPYNLAISSGYFEWNNVTADSALANINFVSGSWGWKSLTPASFGNPAGTLTLTASTTTTIYNTSVINKKVDFQNGLLVAASANNVMSGAMTLEDGYNSFQMNGGCSLTLSNTLSGTAGATLYASGGPGALTLAGNSPSYLGNVYVNGGVVVLDGSIGGTVTTRANTTFAGHGTAGGTVEVNSAFYPGNSGVVGTFTAGGLTLDGSAALTMDLSSSIASGNDAIQVNGNLTMNGNNITINPISGTLANGTYPLISYTGTFSGSIGTAVTTYATSYTLTLTNNTVAKQIQVIVSGTLTPSLLFWNNANSSGQWDIGNSSTWSNATTHVASSPFFTLDSVVLDDSILTAASPVTNINVATTVVPTVITNNSTVNYTLSGSGTISGTGGLVKQGSSTLSLNVAGNFTGPVTISGGTVKTVGNNTLGSVASITVASGATFDFAGNGYSRTNPITLSGTGMNGIGAVYNSGGGIYGEVLNLVLAGDALIGQNGNGRYDMSPGSQISGAHNLTINYGSPSGYGGEINNITVGSTVQGITLTNSVIGLKHMGNAFQNPATVLTLATNTLITFYDDGGSNGLNGSMHLLGGSQWTMNNNISLLFNGNNITAENNALLQTYSSGNDITINSTITLNGVLHIELGDHNIYCTNVISGSGGFFMDYWNHAMILSAANTYTGPTIIDNGLQVTLTGAGSISQSSLIFFGGGSSTSTHIDATGRPDQTLTLASGQTLAGIGAVNGSLVVSAGAILSPSGTNVTLGNTTGANSSGAIAVTTNITLNGTTIIKLNGSGVNDQVQAGGSINYGGTLNLVNISSTPLANGSSFQVFQSGTGSYNGSFASYVPATPGAGLAWDLSQLSSGIIGVKAGATGPVINTTTVSGGKLIFSGTGGTAGNNYAVLTATNLINPQWVPVVTNIYGTDGTFSVTNTISGSTPQLFYRIQSQ